MKKIILFFILFSFLFLVSCTSENVEEMETIEFVEEGLKTINQVTITNEQVLPPVIETTENSKIVWTNNDDEVYTLVLENGNFETMVYPGETVEYVFDVKGTYNYFFLEKAQMIGTVIVN
jgi:plastocyanin